MTYGLTNYPNTRSFSDYYYNNPYPATYTGMTVPSGNGRIYLSGAMPKLINEPPKLQAPASFNKTPFDINKYGDVVQPAIQFVGSAINAFGSTDNTQSLMQQSGSSYANTGDYGYTKQNDIDYKAQMDKVSSQNKMNTLGAMGAGAALGSVIPGVGTAVGGLVGAGVGLITGLFGSAKRKAQARKRLFDAQQTVNRNNNYAQASAQSDYLQNKYIQENGDASNQMLYGAKNGKDKGMRLNSGLNTGRVWSPIGLTSAKPNARVSGGESIFDGESVDNATGTYVNKGKPNKDDQLANLRDQSVVFGDNINLRTGHKYKDEVAPYIQALERINKKYEMRTDNKLNQLRGTIGQYTDKVNQQEINKLKKPIVDFLNNKADEQKQDREMMSYYPSYKCGKDRLPGYAYGRPTMLDTIIPTGTGALLSLGQYFQAKNQRPKGSDVYAGNPYEQAALNQMDSFRINPYVIARANADAERRTAYQIANTGGLTSGQRGAGRIALALGTMANNAKVMSDIELQNIQLAQQAVQAKINAGDAYAKRKMAASAQDYDNYASAHASRQQGMQVGLRNFMEYLNSYMANEYKRRQGNNMLDLYQQQLDMDKQKQLADYNRELERKAAAQAQSKPLDLATLANMYSLRYQWKQPVHYDFTPKMTLR